MRGRGRGRPGILGRFGNFTGLAGIIIVAGFALVGAVITIMQRQDPGGALGICLILGTVIACLAVRARSVRMIIPAPTLCYLVPAAAAGIINDRSADTNTVAYLLHSATWIGAGFLAMAMATLIAIMITFLRLYLDRRAPSARAEWRRGASNGRGPSARRPAALQPDLDATGYLDGSGGSGPMRPPHGPAGPPRRPESGPYPAQSPGPNGSGSYPTAPRPQDPYGPGPSGTGPYGNSQPGTGPYGKSGTGPNGNGRPGTGSNGRQGAGPNGNGRPGTGSNGNGRSASGPYPPISPSRHLPPSRQLPPGPGLPPGRQLPPGKGDRYNFSSGA